MRRRRYKVGKAMTLRFMCVLGMLLLVGCDIPLLRDPPPPPRGPQVTGEALRTTLAGNSVVIDDRLTAPLTVFFTADGEMRGLRSNQYRDRGSWKIENDAVCGAWNNWWGTLNRCWKVYRAGSRVTIEQADGGRDYNVTVAPGNIADL